MVYCRRLFLCFVYMCGTFSLMLVCHEILKKKKFTVILSWLLLINGKLVIGVYNASFFLQVFVLC